MRKFNGFTGYTNADSVSSFTEEKNNLNTPNIVTIVLDDVGFAQLGCYGSDINTPNIDRLASQGLRYNNFHTTAICSATRASLLTGANHHSAGVSTVVESLDGSYPNQLGFMSPEYATIPQVLKKFGYTSYAAGKWHLTPSSERTSAGPFDNWPIGKGFDRFYGFLGGLTDQFNPSLVQDNCYVKQPKSAADGYHLSEDLTDHALGWIADQHSLMPDKPYFLYLAYGAGHAPHQAPREYIDRYRGKFDCGWDAVREKYFRRQKELGIIPEDAILTERNEFVPPWESLSEKEKKVYARLMEVYAGFLEHTDAQIGRVLDYLDRSGQTQNTLVILLSDNGAAAEGGTQGGINQSKLPSFLIDRKNLDLTYEKLDELGSSEYTAPHYPCGWANAGNTPFQWYKVWVYAGGTRDPLIVRFPGEIKDPGSIRKQYLHVTDIAPTIMDIIGADKPDIICDTPQKPYHGISFRYTFGEPDAASKRRVQYYEMNGHRGIYADGWKAVTNHHEEYKDDVWELYHVDEDFSGSLNVAEKYPEKLKELVLLWHTEAGKYGVFPLGNAYNLYTTLNAHDPTDSFSLKAQHIEYRDIEYPVSAGSEVMFARRSHSTTVILRHKKEFEGVLFSAGDRFGGYVLYIKGNRLRYTYNFDGNQYYKAASDRELPEGRVEVKEELIVSRGTGHAIIFINGEKAGETFVPQFTFSYAPAAGIKKYVTTEVSDDTVFPFEYKGVLEKIVLDACPFRMDAGEAYKFLNNID